MAFVASVLAVVALGVSLCACGGEDTAGDPWCERLRRSAEWNRVGASLYRGQSVDGVVVLSGDADGPRTFRDDRVETWIRVDERMLKGPAPRVDLVLVDVRGVAAIVRVPVPAAYFGRRAASAGPGQDVVVDLATQGAELYVCNEPSARIDVAGRCSGGRDPRAVGLDGTLVVHGRPPIQIDDVMDDAFAFGLSARAPDVPGVAVDVEVVWIEAVRACEKEPS